MGVLGLLNLGMPVEVVKQFGGRDKYLQAVQELEHELYRDEESHAA